MGQRKLWNYTPELPVKTAPYWDWPARPVAASLYLLKTWNPAGSRLLFLTVAIVVWTFFTPDLSRAQTLSLDWIAQVWLRNFVILVTVAGGLEVFFVLLCHQPVAQLYVSGADLCAGFIGILNTKCVVELLYAADDVFEIHLPKISRMAATGPNGLISSCPRWSRIFPPKKHKSLPSNTLTSFNAPQNCTPNRPSDL